MTIESYPIRQSSAADDLFITIVTEVVLDLISKEGFALPVGIFLQPFLLTRLNVSGDGLHGFISISFSHGVNHIQMLFVHSRQGFGVMAGMTRGKDTDHIS